MSSSSPGSPFCWVWKWSWLVLQQRRTQASQVSGCHLWKWTLRTLLFFKSVTSKLVRENDCSIKTKDNPNKFNFMVKCTDRSDYKSWLHFAGFISTWICENPVSKHFVIYLYFLCPGLFILCCLFYAAPFLDFIVVRNLYGSGCRQEIQYPVFPGIRDLTKIQWGIRETLTGFDCNWKRDSPMRNQDPASRPLVDCIMTGSSCSDVLVLFLLLMLADLQGNMLISVRCQTRLHIIGATVVAEETGEVAPRTGKMAQTYEIWY